MTDADAPIALRNASARTSVFFTSVLYTSDPTIGQNGTLVPSSCDTASASAVLPVPGAPTSTSARPENLRDLIRSTTTPHAYSERYHARVSVGESDVHVEQHTSRALVWPMNPAFSGAAMPSALRPRPLMCEWGAMRDERAEEAAEGGGRALCVTGVDADGVVVAFMFDGERVQGANARGAPTITSATPVAGEA
jgi:hypothetical protein